jgi:16S rRNA (guanine(527)-N(7))-methyltransferase RsmG
MKIKQKPVDKVWADFQEELTLTDEQIHQFQAYASILLQRNEEFNLTAIRDLSGVLRQHFQDSLALREFVDLKSISTICDVGAGAGFPALPLKILFPHLKVILIEVTKKKQKFLSEVIAILGIENVEICDLDWRTFLRTTAFDVDLFVTRAALDDLELSRAFRASCPYNKKSIVYWISEEWESHPKVVDLVKNIYHYKLGKKNRRLAVLSLPA